MADMGPCKRPGSTGEGTETLAYRKAVPAIRDQASARATETGACRLRVSGARSIKALRGPRCSRSRLTIDIRRALQPKTRRGESSAVPGHRCRRKQRPATGSIARPHIGWDRKREARPCRRAHRNRAEERKRPLPQLCRYAELSKTESGVITRHGGRHSKHECDGGADHWRAERGDPAARVRAPAISPTRKAPISPEPMW